MTRMPVRPQQTIHRKPLLTYRPPPGKEPERGGCLTAWLILQIVAVPILVLFFVVFVFTGQFQQIGVALPGWYIPIFVIDGILVEVFALAIWRWQKWGAIGMIGLYAIGLMLSLFLPNIICGFVSGLVGLALFGYLVGRVWQHLN